MRYLFINSVCGIGSTGRICAELASKLENEGHVCKIAYGRKSYIPNEYQKYAVRIGSSIGTIIHALISRIMDNSGFCSMIATKRFLKWASNYNPDVLWLHNIHGYYINVEMLFAWIKSRPNIQVKWTLHDCWSFTGHCTHFSYICCKQWKSQCQNCPQKTRYPASLIFDNCRKNYMNKKNAFSGVKNLTIITPSVWLASLVKKSFLSSYSIEVQHNEIDRAVFKPTSSDFREIYGLQNKFIVLGVASIWDDRKGLYDFYQLANLLDDRFAIILIGLTRQQIKDLPHGIVGIERTNDILVLVKAYSAADVFVNPSQEETFSMTTLEAQCCGTRAIVYAGTACEEVIDNSNGIVVDNDVCSLKDAIIKCFEDQSILL